MKTSMQWKLVLPLMHLILAISLWLYMPFQFGKATSFGHSTGLPPEVFTRFYPPPAGRVLYALNLPAAALSAQVDSHLYTSTPAWEFTWPAGERRGVVYVVGVRELAFFAGVLLLWFWTGSKINGFIEARPVGSRAGSKALGIAEMVIVFVIAAFLLGTSLICILDKKCPPPEEQIVTFGLIWPVGLFAYFGINLRKRIKRNHVTDKN